MIGALARKLFGSSNDRRVRRYQPNVDAINAMEPELAALSDEALRARTDEFRQQVAEGRSLDDLLVPAFATVREAAKRTLGQRHFDVQLIGGMVLHEGAISEMKTGEGKTLVATLPVYLNALEGKGVHLITVNDYLAKRDAEWMGQIYRFLGLTVGCIQQQMPSELRREMYGRDITYGTASEFGFDYLRDNGMATRKEDQVQRDHWYCIVDEIDSILVDEARTPLIISGPAPIQREQPFTRLKPGVAALVDAQQRLINKLVKEAGELLEKKDATEDDRQRAALKMLQVKLGMPKNKQLLRLMENPEWRKLLDKTDVEMHSDFQKEELYRLKEEMLFVIDEKNHQADLTEIGRNKLRPDDADAFLLPDLATGFSDIEKDTTKSPEEKEQAKLALQQRYEVVSEDIHAISQLLRAYALYERDVEYVIQEGKVVIVDENTGRVMPGRRWSDGLHQAVEAKEGVQIEPENQTLASITFQNYFRMYPKLSGMTGTAATEAPEFFDIYKMNVVSIPTNRPITRRDEEDEFYKNITDKFAAIARTIREASEAGQPVLVGTVSIEKSELLSSYLEKEGVKHEVLNARFHEKEAHIVAQAGRAGAVTIATNMAGRGTDIKLGGNEEFRIEDELAAVPEGPERDAAIQRIRAEVAEERERVKAAGGLFVLATERHESRRIDNQLRGRSGRQGDPGRSKFYLCLDDDLMRIFGPDTAFAKIMNKNLEDGEAIGSKWLSKAIETAQKKVEARNYDIRKQVVEYDNVMNDQRKVIYEQREEIMDSEAVDDVLADMRAETVSSLVGDACPPGSYPEQWDVQGLKDRVADVLDQLVPVEEWVTEDAVEPEIFAERIQALADQAVEDKKTAVDAETWRNIEKSVLLRTLDHHWKEHLATLDALRQAIFLRAYAQKQPINEYKQEAFALFERMLTRIREDVTRTVATLQLRIEAAEALPLPDLPDFLTTHIDPFTGEDNSADIDGGSFGAIANTLPPLQSIRPPLPEGENAFANMDISRNAPCPCGSGRKYKHCHGAI